MKKSVVVFFILSFAICYAQNTETTKSKLTGHLFTDSKIVLNEYVDSTAVILSNNNEGKKSTVLAALMSAVLPGSGELYVGDYLKAAIFFSVEAALITLAVINDNKGDDLTNEFEVFADEHWSVVDYSQYIMIHWQELGLTEQCNISINDNDNLPPWERVNWSDLNNCEGMISVFSHRLPLHGEQQYYELIGKYKQYSSGWDAFNGNNYDDVPQVMLDYAEMREKANDTYNIAAKAVVGIYINHILSAIDAVWSATSYNKDLAVKFRMQNLQFANRIELIPTVNFQYNF